LRSQFDRIVIDAPSAAPLADVGILTPLVDTVLLVVRAGVTSKPAIQDAIKRLGEQNSDSVAEDLIPLTSPRTEVACSGSLGLGILTENTTKCLFKVRLNSEVTRLACSELVR